MDPTGPHSNIEGPFYLIPRYYMAKMDVAVSILFRIRLTLKILREMNFQILHVFITPLLVLCRKGIAPIDPKPYTV